MAWRWGDRGGRVLRWGWRGVGGGRGGGDGGFGGGGGDRPWVSEELKKMNGSNWGKLKQV